ncbi:hypothetical protein [Sporosarcina cyprini]|uniref:hypothetical protein n=1 Tax=Sporosarcina cyprini TaxID=2910523 RepID=UPI001EDCEC72|nr:hypothetical protein [Sporosarcina cyprini]MCG3087730.1 hypothetical protein [Sporosarcina cyprini]
MHNRAVTEKYERLTKYTRGLRDIRAFLTIYEQLATLFERFRTWVSHVGLIERFATRYERFTCIIERSRRNTSG